MEGLFSATNTNFIIIPFIFIGAALLTTAYIIWHKKDKILKILTKSLIIFLIVYFPLLDYWSFWEVSFFWPSDFFHPSGSILSSPDEPQFGHYPTVQIIFITLTGLANFLFLFSSILFIKRINVKQNDYYHFINWIPLINSFSIGYQLKKTLKPKSPNAVLLKAWVLFSFLFVFYRFFSGWLYILGIDSISFIGNILFPDTPTSETPEYYDMGYTYIADLLNIITPPFFYISAILTFFIIKFLKNNPNESLDKEISKIGQN